MSALTGNMCEILMIEKILPLISFRRLMSPERISRHSWVSAALIANEPPSFALRIFARFGVIFPFLCITQRTTTGSW